MSYSIRELASHLSSRTPEKLVKKDIERFRRHHAGPYAQTGTLNGPSLVIGVRSGIFVLNLALNNPHQAMIAVERDANLRQALLESAQHLGIVNLKVYDDVKECIEQLQSGTDVLGQVQIDKSYFTSELISSLCQFFKLDYLSGIFEESQANPLWLHRKSRRSARNFHWQNKTTSLVMPGKSMEGPDVSIIVPAYGIEKYLDKCMESLIEQTLKDLEIIVVDDGAKDRSGQIADDWARRDGRVVVIHQANAGCAAARSNGLKAAKGMFVGLVDGDDWVDSPMFQALAESAVRFTSDIAQCGYRHCFDNDGSWKDEPEWIQLSLQTHPGIGLVKNPRDLIPLRPAIWRRIYRRDFLVANEIDFPKAIRRFDDLPFHFMTLALAQRLSVVNASYYNYRQQRPGQDITVDDERLHVHFPIFSILREFVCQHHTRELEENLFKTQVASHEWACSVIRPELLEQYEAAARYELFGDPISLPAVELLRKAKHPSKVKQKWARRMQRKRGSKEVWLALKDYSG